MDNKLKQFVAFVVYVISLICNMGEALAINGDSSVAVMDFGTRPGASSYEINIENSEYTSCEYVINHLVKKNLFTVMDKDLMLNKLQSEGLSVCGIIDPDSAKKIGNLLNVKYIIYGNVVNISISSTGASILTNIGGGVDVCTVKAHIAMRIMDVDTGEIVMMTKGDGESKSSYVNINAGKNLTEVLTLKIGTVTVTQDSVHNAIMKATQNAVDKVYDKVNKK